jgi:hypothetical protein
LDVAEENWEYYGDLDLDIDKFKIVVIDGKERLLGEPRLDVEKSSTDNFIVVIKKRARGKSNEDARDNVNEVIYKYTVKDSTLFFDPYFLISEEGQWRDQDVDIILKVPEGKAIFLSEKMDEIIHDINNVSNTWDGDMVGNYWEMTPEGLTKKEKSE